MNSGELLELSEVLSATTASQTQTPHFLVELEHAHPCWHNAVCSLHGDEDGSYRSHTVKGGNGGIVLRGEQERTKTDRIDGE
ncbi:hypothetical protein VTL71DRAFT_15184, partial [Oculimacula yallundae]